MHQDQLARIRLLSGRFHELQGLRLALFGAALALSQIAALFTSSNPPALASGVMILVALILASPGWYRLNHYYDATFGRQVRTPASRWRWMFLGLVVGVRLIFGESLPDTAATLALITVLSFWVAMKDWPWRGYYLLAPMAGGLVFAASAAGIGLVEPGKTHASLYLALGLVMIPIGILDHRLLVALVREASSPMSESRQRIRA